MESTIIDTLMNAGPVGILAWILWTVFNRQAASAEKFGDGVLTEMKLDREAYRDEFRAMRGEHRDAVATLQAEVVGLRSDIRSMPAGVTL